MKRIVILIFVLMLTMSTEQAKWFDNYKIMSSENKSIDYMNASLEVLTWPEFPIQAKPIFYEEGKCLLVPNPLEPDMPYLYDIHTGELTGLATLPEDEEKWIDMIGLAVQYDRLTLSDEELAALMKSEGAAGAFFRIVQGSAAYSSYSAAGNHILVNTRGFLYLVDTKNATIRPAAGTQVLEDGSNVVWNIGTYEYIVIAPDGSENYTEFTGDPGYAFALSAVDIDSDTAVCVARDIQLNRDGSNRYCIGFMDAENTAFVNIGGYKVLSGPDCVIACGQDVAIAYSKAGALFYPVVLASRSDKMASVLCWDGTVAKAIPVEECTNAEGFTVKPEDALGLIPLGVSNDGRYAAFIVIDTCDILMMDLETLEVHTLLEYSTVSDTITSPLMTALYWDGGEYINAASGYSLRFIFD